jgi:dihydrolipoamide dehydrogenase
MKTYDVIIIGSGPGGYVAAIRAGQSGLKSALVEKARIGGCCLNWGCIPSRRLMESAKLFSRIQLQAANFGIDGIDNAALKFNWKKAVAEKDKIVTKLVKGVEFLMKKNQVEIISGEAAVTGANQITVAGNSYGFKQLILATGSRPDRRRFAANLPDDFVVEIDDFYARAEIPDRIVVIGGRTVACEMASLLRLIGKQVTVVASQSKLIPGIDTSLSTFLLERFKKLGIRVHLESPMPTRAKNGVKIGDELVECDLVLNCAVRAAVLPKIEGMRIELTEDGFVKVNESRQTNQSHVYAIGDVTGTHYAQHASAHAGVAVSHMLGHPVKINDAKIPINIYTDPEIASVGWTEEQLAERNIPYMKGEFPMQVNSKALVEGNTEGFVKMLADEKYGEVLGVHIVAARATDLISEVALGVNLEATLDDLYSVVHPHPTVSESIMEAGFKAMGRPLHI